MCRCGDGVLLEGCTDSPPLVGAPFSSDFSALVNRRSLERGADPVPRDREGRKT